MMLLILFAVLGLMALCAGVAIFFFLRATHPEPSLLKERLTRMRKQDDKEPENAGALSVTRFYKDADYKNPALGAKFESLSFFRLLKIRLQQAGIKTTADQFFLNRMVIPIAVTALLGLIIRFPLLIFVGFIIAAGFYFSVMIKRGQRYNKFVMQLPDALSLIISALRAGHSFQSSLTVVSSEMADPIGTEFTMLVRDINLGIPVREALVRMVLKLDTLPDVRMFATAVTIQREAGGNLAEVLDNLGYTIRERFKLKGQIASLTGQSRLTGYVLGCAPVAILCGLSLFMFNYVRPLYDTTLGHLLLGVAFILQCIGFFIMKRIIDIRV